MGRLIASLGRMGKTMSGLPEGKEDLAMGEGDGVVATVSGAVEGVVEEVKAAVPAAAAKVTGGGAKKGKKKGKK